MRRIPCATAGRRLPPRSLRRYRGDERTALAESIRGGQAVVVHARVADWRPRPGDGHDWSAVLGADVSRWSRLPRESDRDRFAASRLLLKHLVAAATGGPVERVRLGYRGSRRPYPVGHPVDVNLSHTGDVLLAGVCLRGRIGVDIERADRWLGGPAAAARLCSRREFAALAGLRDAELDHRLLRLWTVKEACAKALGVGLALDLRSLSFDVAPAGVRPHTGLPGGRSAWSVGAVSVGATHVAAVAHWRPSADGACPSPHEGKLR